MTGFANHVLLGHFAKDSSLHDTSDSVFTKYVIRVRLHGRLFDYTVVAVFTLINKVI